MRYLQVFQFYLPTLSPLSAYLFRKCNEGGSLHPARISATAGAIPVNLGVPGVLSSRGTRFVSGPRRSERRSPSWSSDWFGRIWEDSGRWRESGRGVMNPGLVLGRSMGVMQRPSRSFRPGDEDLSEGQGGEYRCRASADQPNVAR